MNLKKIAPWNWFKSEDEEPRYELEAHHHREPGHPLSRLHRDMDRLFDDFFPSNWPVASKGWWKLSEQDELLKPKVDISESKDFYKIEVEVPGVDKGDITIDVQDHAIVVRGEKKQEKKEEGKLFHRVERCYGSFQRILNLPPDADAEDAEAKFKNGILTLKLKRKEGEPTAKRRIEID